MPFITSSLQQEASNKLGMSPKDTMSIAQKLYEKGYITYNDITPESFQSFRRDEIVEMLPDANVYDENPLTHPRNCIIVWGEASE